METALAVSEQMQLHLLYGATSEIYYELSNAKYKWTKRECSWDDVLLKGKTLWGKHKWVSIISDQYSNSSDQVVLQELKKSQDDLSRLNSQLLWCLDPSDDYRLFPVAQPDCNFRKLRYYFLCLPYGRQIQIAQELDLLKDEDAGVKDPILFMRLCERSIKERKVLKLWCKSKEFYTEYCLRSSREVDG